MSNPRARAQTVDPKTIEQLALLTLTNVTKDDVVRVLGTSFREDRTGQTRMMRYGALPRPPGWPAKEPPPAAFWVNITNETLRGFGVGGEPILSMSALDRLRPVLGKNLSLPELLALLGPPSGYSAERRIYHWEIQAPDALRRATGLVKLRLRWRHISPTNGLYYMGMIPSTDIASRVREFQKAGGPKSPVPLAVPEPDEDMKQALAQLISDAPPPAKNQEQQARLEKLLARVVPGTPPDFLPITIRVLDSRVVNAFSFPLTNRFCLGVTSRMMELVSSDEELAALIAHEIGHGIEETPSKEKILRWTTLDRDRLFTLQVYSWTWRSRELSSDGVAIDLLRAAGYPSGALQRALRHFSQQISLTHPATGLRDGFLNWYGDYRAPAGQTPR